MAGPKDFGDYGRNIEVAHSYGLTITGIWLPLLVDADRHLQVDASGGIAGTVTANQGAAGAAAWPVTGATGDSGPEFGTLTRTCTESADASTATAITAAPTAGQKIVALDVLVSVDTDCYLTLQEETSATVLAGLYLPANGSAQVTLRGLLPVPTADRKLMVKTSVASKCTVTALYYSEA